MSAPWQTLALQPSLAGNGMHSTDDLIADLDRLGLARGDAVMVHASLRAIGPVDGGADGVLDALDSIVGPSGTLLMTLGARDDWGWVNELPEGQRRSALRNAVPFDKLLTPADPDVGVLAETFRRRSGTMVSDHPEGRFGARGRLAATLVADVPWNDYYGSGSPLERLIGESGKVLRLGADLDTLTLLHYAEYLVPLPHKRRARRHRLVSTPQGVEIRTIDCLDDSNGIVDHSEEDYFAAILRDYLSTGRPLRGVVGSGRSELMQAVDVVEFAVAWMLDHFANRSLLDRSS